MRLPEGYKWEAKQGHLLAEFHDRKEKEKTKKKKLILSGPQIPD